MNRVIKFRIHRGSYEESMKGVVTISSMQELKKYLQSQFIYHYDVKFDERTVYDSRNGWNSVDVLIQTKEGGKWGIVGQADGILNN